MKVKIIVVHSLSEPIKEGSDGVLEIIEKEPKNGLEKWNYLVKYNNGGFCRFFDVIRVYYTP